RTPPSPLIRTVDLVGGSHVSVLVKSDRNSHTAWGVAVVVTDLSILGMVSSLVDVLVVRIPGHPDVIPRSSRHRPGAAPHRRPDDGSSNLPQLLVTVLGCPRQDGEG